MLERNHQDECVNEQEDGMFSSLWNKLQQLAGQALDAGVQPQGSGEPVAPAGDGNTIRMRLVFHGRVQGVGFRFMAVTHARPRGLTGWVKNELDGSVSMEVQGTPDAINGLVDDLRRERFIRIADIESEKIPVNARETTFRERQ